jgi:hypothetical protein
MKRRFWLRSTLAASTAAAVSAVAAPTAFGAEDWCDCDPVQIVITSGGKIVPIFVTAGARGLLNVTSAVLAKISSSSKSVDGGTATEVTVNVTVPRSLLSKSFDTRFKVSSGPLGLLKEYATAYGVSGQTMTAQFTLPVG